MACELASRLLKRVDQRVASYLIHTINIRSASQSVLESRRHLIHTINVQFASHPVP